MAHVAEAPNGKGWECRWSFPDPGNPSKRKFQKQRFRLKEQARAKAREIEERQAQGLIVDHRAGKESLEAWANRWHTEYARTVKPSTAKKCRGLLDTTVIPRLGHLRVRDVRTSTVSDWLDWIESSRTSRDRKGNISPATIKHHYLVLRNVLRYAAREGAISFNPAEGVRLPTDRSRGRTKREPRFLTVEQVAHLAGHMPYPYGLLVQFLAFTGLRVGECAGLNIEDVDLGANCVRVRRTRTKVKGGWDVHTPKSGKTRSTPLPVGLARALREYVDQHPHANDPTAPFWPGRKIVARSKGGNTGGLDYDQPWNRNSFYRRHFHPALKAAALPADVTMHDLRHTFASICASNGIPAAQVAEWMGHSNEIVTRTIYTHLFKEDTTRHESALSAAFAGGVGDNVVPFPKQA
jgi:integrase